MRGKEVQLGEIDLQDRITPAYAGKRLSLPIFTTRCWDHPRVCGEKKRRLFSSEPGPGSPPRMRGKANSWMDPLSIIRITPAYAGKRVMPPVSFLPAWDHPRVCGEKNGIEFRDSFKLGSPPRMRGKETCKKACEVSWGITPAYAGKRLKRSHSIGHFSCILRLFHSVLHRASASGGSRAGPCAPPCLPAQNAVPV